jgi:anti-sigma regulatory factor (Ser/Thr protein kinase)
MSSETPAGSICTDGVAIVREFLAEPRSASKARAVVRSFLEECAVRAESVHEVITAAGEALMNSIEHAYPSGSRGKVVLSIYCCREHQVIALQVRDNGRMAEDRDRPGNRGFGLLIMRALAEAMSVDTTPGGTAVTMVFRK